MRAGEKSRSLVCHLDMTSWLIVECYGGGWILVDVAKSFVCVEWDCVTQEDALACRETERA